MYICTDQEQGKTTSRGLCTIIGSSHMCFIFSVLARGRGSLGPWSNIDPG